MHPEIFQFLEYDALLQTNNIIELWNNCFEGQFPLDKKLYLQHQKLNQDEQYTLCCQVDSKIIGAVCSKVHGSYGYISFIIVNPKYQNRGIGKKLFSLSLEWLNKHKLKNIKLGADRNHFFPGIPQKIGLDSIEVLAKQNNFEMQSIEFDLVCNLKSLAPNSAIFSSDKQKDFANNFIFKSYENYDKDNFFNFMNETFPGRWTSDTELAMQNGMRNKDLILVINKKDNKVIGFSRIYDDDSTILGPGVYWREIMSKKPGGLGPIGISNNFRGLGLGIELLRYCMIELYKRNVDTMVIDWTTLKEFYGKMGFTEWKCYKTMVLQK